MPLETKITATIEAEVNKKSFGDGVNFARDTGKKIDKELKRKLELDVAGFQVSLDQARRQLKVAKDSMDKDAVIKAQLDVNGQQRSLTEARRQLNNYVNTGDKDLSRLQAKFNSVNDTIKAQGGLIGALGQQLGALGLTAGLTAVSNGVLTLAGNLEQARVSFGVMLGSAEKAGVLLKDLAAFAKATPFELVDLRNQSKQLLAFGFTAKDIIPTLQILGNISAGVGTDKLPRLTYALGQVRAAGKLTGQDLRQFTEAGVPLLEELSKITGITTKEMVGNVGDLGIGYEYVLKALENLTSKGGRFYGLMEAQSRTFQGAVSNLKDSLNLLGEQIGAVFVTTLTPLVQGFTSLITRIGDVAKAFPLLSQVMGVALGTLTLLAVGFTGLGFILPALTTGLGALGIAFTGTTVAIGGTTIALTAFLGYFAVIIAGLALLAKAWVSNWGGIQEKTRAVLKTISQVTGIIIDDLKSILPYLNALLKMFSNLAQGVAHYLGIIKTTTDKFAQLTNNKWASFAKDVFLSQFRMFTFLTDLYKKSLSALDYITGGYLSKIAAKFRNLFSQNLANENVSSAINAALNAGTPTSSLDLGGGAALGNFSPSGGGGKGGAKDPQEEAKKKAEEFAQEMKKIQDDIASNNEARMKVVRERGQAAFKAITDAINESKKAAQDFNKEIENIDKQLGDIQTSIGKRVIDIEKQISDISTKQVSGQLDIAEAQRLSEERLKLEQELALAKGAISAEELQKLREEEAKSETQKLIDRRAALESERAVLQEKAAFEVALQEQLQKDKINLERSFTARYHEELEKQTNDLKAQIETRVQYYRDLEAAARAAGVANGTLGTIPSKGGSTGSNNPYVGTQQTNTTTKTVNSSNTSNQVTNYNTFNQNISNDVGLGKATRQIQLATKGIT